MDRSFERGPSWFRGDSHVDRDFGRDRRDRDDYDFDFGFFPGFYFDYGPDYYWPYDPYYYDYYGYTPYYNSYAPDYYYTQTRKAPNYTAPLTEDQARGIMGAYLDFTHNPDLKLAQVKQTGLYYEGLIVGSDNHPVDNILVDRYTGWAAPGEIASVYPRTASSTLSRDDAQSVLDDFLASTKNPDLKLTKIGKKGDAFIGDITDKSGTIERVYVDRYTGWLRFEQ